MMAKTVRQSEIIDLVRRRGCCPYSEIARKLSVSEETARRNVKSLVAEGLLIRVRGGAALPARLHEQPLHSRLDQNRDAKIAVARRLAAEISDDETLMMDAGSTTICAARALLDKSNLLAVTNSLPVAATLAGRNGNTVYMSGGEIRAHDAAVFGPEAYALFRRFETKWAILSASALRLGKGLMVCDLCEADLARIIIDRAERVIVAADASKFDRVAPIKVCDLDEIDLLVTDAPPPAPLAEGLSRAKTRVLIAETAADVRSAAA
jgi:DeoR family glycerol-3-phosphate regulon repressor